MKCAQIKAGNKLHFVYEGGEGPNPADVVPKDAVSAPLCGTAWAGRYRYTINVPLAHACKNCLRVLEAECRRVRRQAPPAREIAQRGADPFL